MFRRIWERLKPVQNTCEMDDVPENMEEQVSQEFHGESGTGVTRRHAIVYGQVQHVGFRWSMVQRAMALNLTGWVRNLISGEVEAEFQGTPEAVLSMANWLRHGPRYATVERVWLEVIAPIEKEKDFRPEY